MTFEHKRICLIIYLPVFIIIYIYYLTHYYMIREQYLYSWDTISYYESWRDFISLLNFDIEKAVVELFKSIRSSDYNILPVSITSFFGIIIGTDREIYIQSLSLVYIPFIIILYYLSLSYFKIKNLILSILVVLLPLTFTPFYAPTFRGYPDISGLIFVILSIIICEGINFDNLSVRNILYSILLGITLWCAFLFRRWYAYSVVSLYISLPFFNYLLRNNQFLCRNILYVIFNFFIAAICSLVLVLIFQTELVFRILSTNYSFIYQAYDRGFLQSVYIIANNVGLIYVCLSVFFAMIIMIYSERNIKIYLLFIIFNLLFSSVIFCNTQSPGLHHCLPFSFWILSIIGLGMIVIFNKMKFNRTKFTLIIPLTVLLFSIQYYSMFSSNQALSFILPSKCLPLSLKNYNNYKLLVDYLSSLDKDEKISIFASSSTLNDSVIAFAFDNKLKNRILFTSHVDLRDHINFSAYLSKFVVVTPNAQIHLPLEQQQVIAIPNDMIFKKYGIGFAYKKIAGPFTLDNTDAYVYEKVRSYNKAEINELLNTFYDKYPQWKKDHNQYVLYTYLLVDNLKLGDIWGGFALNNDDSISTHPGNSTATSFSLSTEYLNEIEFKSVNNSCNMNDDILVYINGSVYNIEHGKSIVIDVMNEINYVDISITKNISAACDALHILMR